MARVDTYRGRALVHPDSPADWRAWLSEHHATQAGAWVARWPRATGREELDYDQMVEEALCFGWIDGLVNTLPDGRQAALLTPRRPGSAWSGTNKERVARLEADGRMSEAGRSVIERAKADGSWSLQDAAEALIEPDELAAALDARPEARRYWNAFPKSPRRALIWWVMSARRPETKQRRVATIVEEAAHDRRANY